MNLINFRKIENKKQNANVNKIIKKIEKDKDNGKIKN